MDFNMQLSLLEKSDYITTEYLCKHLSLDRKSTDYLSSTLTPDLEVYGVVAKIVTIDQVREIMEKIGQQLSTTTGTVQSQIDDLLSLDDKSKIQIIRELKITSTPFRLRDYAYDFIDMFPDKHLRFSDFKSFISSTPYFQQDSQSRYLLQGELLSTDKDIEIEPTDYIVNETSPYAQLIGDEETPVEDETIEDDDDSIFHEMFGEEVKG